MRAWLLELEDWVEERRLPLSRLYMAFAWVSLAIMLLGYWPMAIGASMFSTSSVFLRYAVRPEDARHLKECSPTSTYRAE